MERICVSVSRTGPPRGGRQRRAHLRVLLVLEVLVDGGVEVLGVALVEAVDLPLGLDPHVPLGQDELADGLSVKSGEDVGQVKKKKKNRVNIKILNGNHGKEKSTLWFPGPIT